MRNVIKEYSKSGDRSKHKTRTQSFIIKNRSKDAKSNRAYKGSIVKNNQYDSLMNIQNDDTIFDSLPMKIHQRPAGDSKLPSNDSIDLRYQGKNQNNPYSSLKCLLILI